MRQDRTSLALVSVASVLATLLAAQPAAADRISYHATATSDVAFTDNVFSERRGSQDGDLFFQVRPGVRFTYGVPRMIHDLDVEGEVTQYALHSEEASVTGRAGWRALFLPGPRSEVLVSAEGGSSVLSALSARASPDQPVVEIRPLGNLYARSASATQYASWIASRDLRLSQGLYARASETDNREADPLIITSAEAGARIALDRYFRRHALTVELGASVLRLERDAPMADPIGSRLDRQINPRARVAWRHELDRRVALGVDGGLVYVIPFGEDPANPGRELRDPALYPVVGVSADITDVWGAGRMSLRHDVSANLFLGQNTVNDTAVISAAMPIAWRGGGRRRQPRLVGLGSVSVTRTQLVDPFTSDPFTSDLQSSIGLARLDVGFMYAVRPGFTYGVRYELMVQTGDRTAQMPITGFFRNTLFVTFKLRYPEDLAAQVPKRRANTGSSDRQDLVPIGAEPVVPDLIEDAGGEE